MNIERKKIAILLTAVAVAAIMSGIALTAFAADNGEESGNEPLARFNEGMMSGMYGWTHGRMHGCGCFGFVEVSEEFEASVTDIAESDEDVQNLLDDGYNVTGVRPIIKTVVEADGSVVTKATSGVVMLEKDTIGRATVWVDLEEGKVTEIVILTRTVIEKP